MAAFLRRARFQGRALFVPGSSTILAGMYYQNHSNNITYAEEVAPTIVTKDATQEPSAKPSDSGSTGPDNATLFHGLFPERQLWKSKMAHPALWDRNWDDRAETTTGDASVDREREREIRRRGVTRHIILVRHGQYDETHPEDEKRILTPLGREQADLTGKRLAEIVEGARDAGHGPCNVRVVRVSDLYRAKETADLIAKHLPGVERAEPDPLLNEGRPCHNIPGGRARSSVVQKVDEQHPRIEEAFRKYFHRAPPPCDDAAEEESRRDAEKKDETVVGDPKHEFEIIVCHANVIRYFFCRALQLPPECWLRLCTFNCSLTYLTVRPTGTVSCRMLGDIGHLGYDKSTFSGHHGFNW